MRTSSKVQVWWIACAVDVGLWWYQLLAMPLHKGFILFNERI